MRLALLLVLAVGVISCVCLNSLLVSVKPLHKELAKYYPVPLLLLLFTIPEVYLISLISFMCTTAKG